MTDGVFSRSPLGTSWSLSSSPPKLARSPLSAVCLTTAHEDRWAPSTSFPQPSSTCTTAPVCSPRAIWVAFGSVGRRCVDIDRDQRILDVVADLMGLAGFDQQKCSRLEGQRVPAQDRVPRA